MKISIVPTLAILVAAGFSAASMAQTAPKTMDGHAAMKMSSMPMAMAGESTLVDGLVKKVDPAAGKITLSHGPLPGGMPAMTMAYRVKDKAVLGQLKPGQKIRFSIDPDDGMTVQRIEMLK